MPDYASNDPFRPLLSLADQKKLSLGNKYAEKVSAMSESAVLTEAKEAQDRLRNEGDAGSNLIDIAQSSIFQGNEVLFDAANKRTRSPEEIQELGDRTRGVTEEARQRLVTQPQQEVIESLAAGKYLDALVGSVKAAPGTLADSANVIPEILAGAGLTIAGGSGLGVIGNRIRKIFGGVKSISKKVSKVKKAQGRLQLIKEAAKTIPKTASQMSVVTADITQRQIADFEAEFGERPSNERIAQFYLTNLATMTAEGGILKQLFIPNFKKEFKKEASAVLANMRGGSNLVSIGTRIGAGIKKVLIASGAEAAQEYAQTWADIINPGVGPNENFIKGMKREFGNKNNQLQALGGSFLGFGAGGLARGVVTAPAVTAGTTLDVTKGTIKTAAKGTVALVKTAGKVAQAVTDKTSFRVLSKEEVAQIKSEHGSRKAIIEPIITKLNSAVETIKKATTIEELRADPEINKRVSSIIQNKEIGDNALKNKAVIKRIKQDLLSKYRGDIGLLEAKLVASTAASVVKQSAKNVERKALDTAVATMKAISPGVKAVIESVKEFGPKVKKAVEEINSSTARGMIELAATAGKKETQQILLAAKSLNMDDLQRATAVIASIKPDLGQQLQRVVRAKEKALERSGLKRNDIINSSNLNPIVSEVATRGTITSGEAASLSSAINETIASKIDDTDVVSKLRQALSVLEKSEDFIQQKNGAMSKDNAKITQQKLNRVEAKLKGRPKKVVDKIKETAEKVTEAVTPVLKKTTTAAKNATEAVKTAIKEVDTVKINSTFRAVTEAVTATLKDPKLASALADSAGDFLKQMRRYGVNTRAQFESFVEQFPDLQTNVEFFKQLDEAYPTNISANEIFDNVKTKAVETVQKMKDAYTSMFPACKI